MTPILIIPGLGGSGPHHWQTYLERSFPGASRVHQDDWDWPDRDAWTERLTTAIAEAPGAVLVAHSLGCAAVAHAVTARPDLPVSAALLVAPADVDGGHGADRLRGFAPMPCTPLPFRSIVVASADDPYVTLARACAVAANWGAEFVNAGALGHINVESGFGPWPDGERLLRRLITTRSRAYIAPPVPTLSPDDASTFAEGRRRPAAMRKTGALRRPLRRRTRLASRIGRRTMRDRPAAMPQGSRG